MNVPSVALSAAVKRHIATHGQIFKSGKKRDISVRKYLMMQNTENKILTSLSVNS